MNEQVVLQNSTQGPPLGPLLLGMLLGAILLFVILYVTVIRKQKAALKKAAEDVERAQSAKSRFIANISHEIRTPINTILGMDEMILREDHKDVPPEYLMAVTGYAQDIRRATESLLTLANDIIDLSKIESGQMELSEEEYDPEALLRDDVSLVRTLCEQKGLSFRVSVDEQIPKKLFGDVKKIKQILTNLLTNAIKNTEEGGLSLDVSVREKSKDSCRFRFTVRDSGKGIKSEDMERLYDAFERLNDDKTDNGRGTGIGLNLSKRFANIMGGKLECESTYGQGSTFTFTVAQKVIDETPIGPFSEEVQDTGVYVPQFSAPDAKVLVVDDEPMNLSVIKGLLMATKMQILTAEGGRECLEILQKETVQLVLLDHMMPEMDGLETCEKIREKSPGLPVIALTANAANGEIFYKEHGFSAYLAKPVDGVALEKVIVSFLPDEMIREPQAGAEPVLTQLPDDKAWLREVEELSIPQGIRYSGGVENFLSSLKMFRRTIEKNAHVIEKALSDGDIRLFTVKVHALKSAARIIGAGNLSEAAKDLEDAGNREDLDFIRSHTEKLLTSYRSFLEKLERLKDPKEDAQEKEEIPGRELKEAYVALSEVVSQMDYDAVEMILEQVGAYRLPEEDAVRFEEMKEALQVFDWEKLGELTEGTV